MKPRWNRSDLIQTFKNREGSTDTEASDLFEFILMCGKRRRIPKLQVSQFRLELRARLFINLVLLLWNRSLHVSGSFLKGSWWILEYSIPGSGTTNGFGAPCLVFPHFIFEYMYMYVCRHNTAQKIVPFRKQNFKLAHYWKPGKLANNTPISTSVWPLQSVHQRGNNYYWDVMNGFLRCLVVRRKS